MSPFQSKRPMPQEATGQGPAHNPAGAGLARATRKTRPLARRSAWHLALVAAFSLPIGSALAAPGDPVGGEFQVNSFMTGDQFDPDVATDADGDFVITWVSTAQDGSGYGVFAQRFSVTGVAQGSEFQVNTTVDRDQRSPSVAMDADGDFVIAWVEVPSRGSTFLFARRYNAAGEALGPQFRVSIGAAEGRGIDPDVAMDADGDFVIAWTSPNGADPIVIFARRFNANGVGQGEEFSVAELGSDFSPFGVKFNPISVAMDQDGDFVVAFREQPYYLDQNILAVRFNASGAQQGTQFRVNTFTGLNVSLPSAAMDASGNFVIAWRSVPDQDGGRGFIYARRYDTAGTPQGTEFQVNTFDDPTVAVPAAAMDADGDFVVTWSVRGRPPEIPASYGVFGQRYNAVGVAQGTEFLVNTTTSGVQDFPAAAMDADGDFVVAWISRGQDSDGFGIFAQRFEGSGGPPPTCAGLALTTGCIVNGVAGQLCLGTDGRDVILGTPRRDVIQGLGRNDRIDGLAGNDVICGGSGRDILRGGGGRDRLFGEQGDDTLVGDQGDDAMNGGPGTDLCEGRAGTDTAKRCETLTGVP